MPGISDGFQRFVLGQKLAQHRYLYPALQKLFFKHGNVNSLREKIEYLYEHPELRKELGKKYEESAPQFALKEMVDKLEKMFELAIEEAKEKKDIPHQIYCKADHKRAKKIYTKLEKKGVVSELPSYCFE